MPLADLMRVRSFADANAHAQVDYLINGIQMI